MSSRNRFVSAAYWPSCVELEMDHSYLEGKIYCFSYCSDNTCSFGYDMYDWFHDQRNHLSRYVFDFLNIRGFSVQAGTVHMICAYWGFILMSLHLGIHWEVFISKIGKLFNLGYAAVMAMVVFIGHYLSRELIKIMKKKIK